MTKDSNDRVQLTYDEAVAMLPEGDMVHTFINGLPGMIIGANWEREKLLEAFRSFRTELSGEMAQSMGHGLVFHDGHHYVFVETKENDPKRTEETVP